MKNSIHCRCIRWTNKKVEQCEHIFFMLFFYCQGLSINFPSIFHICHDNKNKHRWCQTLTKRPNITIFCVNKLLNVFYLLGFLLFLAIMWFIPWNRSSAVSVSPNSWELRPTVDILFFLLLACHRLNVIYVKWWDAVRINKYVKVLNEWKLV